MADKSRLRVLILSHGHPELSKGGAEQASYALFRFLKERTDIDPVYVARCEPTELGHAGDFGAFRGRSDEVLWAPPPWDHFRQQTQHYDRLKEQAAMLIENLKPDVVNMHHYLGFGSDLMSILGDDLGCPVVFTVHEFLAICANHGQMLKTNGKLCHVSSPAECHACFPEHAPGRFFRRRRGLLDHMAVVKRFISPSEFLRQRYIDWGIEADRIRMIENPLAAATAAVSAPARRQASGTKVFGFFGQINPFKGVEVLLNAATQLEKDDRERLRIVIYGANLERQVPELRERIEALLEKLDDSVTIMGSYRNEEVLDLMRAMDWVVVPSIWWENSPVVIQEAKAAGVPVLASNIGGMKEKVLDGVTGAHFIAGNAADLASRLSDIVNGRLSVELPDESYDNDDLIREIVDVYREAAG